MNNSHRIDKTTFLLIYPSERITCIFYVDAKQDQLRNKFVYRMMLQRERLPCKDQLLPFKTGLWVFKGEKSP